jgi:hypothetical protein
MNELSFAFSRVTSLNGLGLRSASGEVERNAGMKRIANEAEAQRPADEPQTDAAATAVRLVRS